MLARTARPAALAVLLACTPTSPPAPDAAPTSEAPRSSTATAEFDEASLAHASISPRGLRALWSVFVQHETTAKFVAELGAAGGVDLAAIDPVTTLGLADDAKITAMLARPVGPVLAVRTGVERLAVPDPAGDLDFVATPFGGSPPPPLPDELVRATGALYLHNRVHIPTRAPEQLIARLHPTRESAGLCPRLPPHDGCSASATGVLVLRRRTDAVVIDMFVSAYPGTGALADPERVDAIATALASTPIAPPQAPVPAADLDLTLHGSALPGLIDLGVHMFLVNRLRDTHAAARVRQIQQTLGMRDAALRLRDTRRLFSGLRITATFDPEFRALLTWQPIDAAAAATVDALFPGPTVALDAPQIDALCHGARACGRLARLPSAAGFAALAVGEYTDQNTLDRTTLTAGYSIAAVVFVLETWPNLIASLTRWHERPDAGPDATAIRSFVDLAGRIDSSGFRLSRGDDPSLAYARLRADDLTLLRTLATSNGIVFAATPSAGLPHAIATASLAGFPTFLATDPDARAGWIVTTDDPATVRWLLADVALEPLFTPALHLATDDLGELVSTHVGPALATWQPWMSARSLSLATYVAAGSPRIHVSLGAPRNH